MASCLNLCNYIVQLFCFIRHLGLMDLQTINIALHKEQTKEKCIAERRRNGRMEGLVHWQRVLMEV